MRRRTQMVLGKSSMRTCKIRARITIPASRMTREGDRSATGSVSKHSWFRRSHVVALL
jgi:hypothetical protein